MDEKKPHGRPTKFTPERCESMLRFIASGVPYKMVALGHGICEETFYDWLRHGLEELNAGLDTPRARFSESVKNAELQKIQNLLEKIDAGVERWQSCAWLLERRWREQFGQDAGIILELQKEFLALREKMQNINQG